MNLKAVLAIILCKALRLVSRLLHRGGTAMPGRYALKLCPDLLSRLAKNVKTVAVTGTNGKTTSARMIEEAFEKEGKSYFSNRSGANLISGITTEFVMNSSLGGKMRKEYAIIECDEAAATRVFGELQPEVIVVTNLFRDQLDRYGDVTNTLSSIRKGIEKAPGAVLCLNADDSLTSSLALDMPNKCVFFGIEKSAAGEHSVPELSDASHCIRCKAEYQYDYISYGHLGGFRCPKCGYSRHSTDYAVTEIAELSPDYSDVIMSVRGEKKLVRINLPAVYNIYNAVGALAAIMEMGMDAEAAVKALSGFKCGFGRMENFKIGSAQARMMLVKNPAGCNQVIDFLSNMKEKFSLVIALNDKPGDGTDVSWIWDTDFEGLCSMAGLERIFVSGDRAADMRVRLKYAGIPDKNIVLEKDRARLAEELEKLQGQIYIMPNYTSMLEIRQAIVERCGGSNFWE